MVTLNIEVPGTYHPSDGELNNFVYLTCKYTVGWNMRETDLHICKLLAGKGEGKEYLERLLEATCEYIWDHIMGEPEDFNSEMLAQHMKPILEDWYSKTTPDERSNIW